MAANDRLPKFTEHGRHTKNHPIMTPSAPSSYIQHFLESSLRAMGRGSPEGVRVLDVGCGRGDTVAWLLARGWRAYGVDVSSAYLEHGRDYLLKVGENPERLQLLCDDLTYPFDDDYFDLVISDQVIEHVSDLGAFAREIFRVSTHGAVGLHIYPAKWRPIEVHMMTPFAHWFPKGPARRKVIVSALSLGLAAPYFKEFPLRERAEIFSRFSEGETFYRSIERTTATLEYYGLDCDAIAPSRHKVVFHMPRLPTPTIAGFGWLYRHAFSVALHTRKI